MAGRSFTRHSNGVGNRIRAEHINELQSALEEDDSRIDLKTDDGQFTAHVDDTDNPHNVTKDQVGLGNVDNTSDADKPVSTAQQAALDGKADIEDAVPDGGVYGQVLTVTHAGRQWADPPGIVYPSLLLSPDGSFDRNGPVSPTVVGDVQVVPGQHGQAWSIPGNANLRVNASYFQNNGGTVLARMRLATMAGSSLQAVISRTGSTESLLYIGALQNYRPFTQIGNSVNATSTPLPTGTDLVAGGQWTATTHRPLRGNWQARNEGQGTGTNSAVYVFFPQGATTVPLIAESLLVYPGVIPDAEIERLSNMPAAWTLQNTAVNMALQSQPPATPTGASLLAYFPPNRKIAAGGATLRTAPGASTTAITALSAGTDVHSTGQTVTASSVSYTLIMTSLGQGFVPTSSLI